MITIETQGRRHYLRGDTYPIRDQLRAAGAHWDPDERAWWTGRREVAEQFAADAAASASADNGNVPRDGIDTVVAGRATYRGRTYYLAGRRHGDRGVAPVQARGGSRMLLIFRDGTSQFWASTDAVSVDKTYRRPQTIAMLREYAEAAKNGVGCYMCGRTYCDGARGGLCEDD